MGGKDSTRVIMFELCIWECVCVGGGGSGEVRVRKQIDEP